MINKKPYAHAVKATPADPDAAYGGSRPARATHADDELDDDLEDDYQQRLGDGGGGDQQCTHLDFGNLALLICAALLCAFSFYSYAANMAAAAAVEKTAASGGAPITTTPPATAFTRGTAGLHFRLANMLRARYDLVGLPIGCVSALLVVAAAYALVVASRRRQPGFHGLEPTGPGYLKAQYVLLVLALAFCTGALALLLTLLPPLQDAYASELAYRAEQLQIGMPVPPDANALAQQQEQSMAQAMLQAPLAPMRTLPSIQSDVFIGLVVFTLIGVAYAMLGNIRARWEQTPTPLAPKSMRAAALALLFVCVAAISFNSIVVQCYGSLSVRMWPFYSMLGVSSWSAKIALSAILMSLVSAWGRDKAPCIVNVFESTLVVSASVFALVGMSGLFGLIALPDEVRSASRFMIANAVISVLGGIAYAALYWTWLRWRAFGDLGAQGEYVPVATTSNTTPSRSSSTRRPEGISLER